MYKIAVRSQDAFPRVEHPDVGVVNAKNVSAPRTRSVATVPGTVSASMHARPAVKSAGPFNASQDIFRTATVAVPSNRGWPMVSVTRPLTARNSTLTTETALEENSRSSRPFHPCPRDLILWPTFKIASRGPDLARACSRVVRIGTI